MPFSLLVQRMGIPFKGSVCLQPEHWWLWPHHHWGSIQIKALRQHTHYSISYIQRLLPMTGMVMLYQVSFIFYFFSTLFFYIIIHLNTTVLETNIVTYLNIVKIKLTTLFTERLGSSSCHFHIILWLPQMMHRVHKDMKSSWILATLLKALESKLSQWKILEL